MKNKYMIATKAFHKLGEISRSEPDLCVISKEDADNYYGSWVTGFGFIEVRFPKKTTRALTAEDVEKYKGRYGIGKQRFEITSEELAEDAQ